MEEGGCDHPRGTKTSWARQRGNGEELRPPFDAGKVLGSLNRLSSALVSFKPAQLRSSTGIPIAGLQEPCPPPLPRAGPTGSPGLAWQAQQGRAGRSSHASLSFPLGLLVCLHGHRHGWEPRRGWQSPGDIPRLLSSAACIAGCRQESQAEQGQPL